MLLRRLTQWFFVGVHNCRGIAASASFYPGCQQCLGFCPAFIPVPNFPIRVLMSLGSSGSSLALRRCLAFSGPLRWPWNDHVFVCSCFYTLLETNLTCWEAHFSLNYVPENLWRRSSDSFFDVSAVSHKDGRTSILNRPMRFCSLEGRRNTSLDRAGSSRCCIRWWISILSS